MEELIKFDDIEFEERDGESYGFLGSKLLEVDRKLLKITHLYTL